MTSITDSASFILAQAAPAGGTQPNPMPQIIFMVLMLAAMYFFMIAPQRKKQKEHQKMLESLGAGDEVLTIGGIYGEITNTKDDRFVVRIADGVKVEITKSAVQNAVKKGAEEKK